MDPMILKSMLMQEIDSLDPLEYSKSPGKDFSRSRKLPFNTLIMTMLRMEGRSMGNELISIFPKASESPSVSAFVQQRSKLRPGVFDALFRALVEKAEYAQTALTFNGLRFLAVDGSDILIPTDTTHFESLIPQGNSQTSHNLLHLNAMYDLLQRTYVDEIIQNHHDMDEHKAFTEMVDRSSFKDVLVVADRGYESFNNMAHATEKGWFFLIRAKDINSNGIVSGIDLPKSDSFDVPIELNLTRKQSNETKQLFKDRNHYRFVPKPSTFDYLPASCKWKDPAKWYRLSFRIVRFPVSDDSYEVILTNLPADDYPPDVIKRLYSMRWGIETSFRSLKYTVGLLYSIQKRRSISATK